MSILKRVKLTNLFKISLFIILFSSTLLSQPSRLADPLTPEKLQTQRELGIYFGLGQNIQTGSFRTQCDCPEFENGLGFGWKAGLLYEQDINSDFQIGAAVGINSLGVVSSYQYHKDRAFVSTITGTIITDTVPILFEQKAETTFLNFTLMPYLKWSVSDVFFIRFGFEAGFNFHSNIKHSEEILQRTVTLPKTGEIITVSFEDGSSTAVVEDGSFPDMITPQLNILPAIGLNLKLAKNIYLSPIFDFSYPLTNMSSYGTNFSVINWRIVAELRWAIQMRQI